MNEQPKSPALADLESRAIALMRRVASVPVPLQRATESDLADVVRDAYFATAPEQQEAVEAVRDTLAELPAQPSPQLAAAWWAHVRGVLQQVDRAVPEGGDQ